MRDQLAASEVDLLRSVDTGTIANAIDHLGLRPSTAGYTSSELRCLFPDLGPMVGFAVTCREDTTTPRRNGRQPFAEVYRTCVASNGPVAVICQDVGGERLRSCHLGDMMSTLMQRIGVVGFVTDGGVRDVQGIREHAPGFHVFAAGLVPGAGESHLVDIGSPVSICGMEVRMGDLVYGDANGLITVPAEAVGDILEEAAKVREHESQLVERIRSSDFTLDSYLQRR